MGKTTRPFRYDLNHIPYNYTVEVRNRFQGLDLIDRVLDELWNEVRDIVQETGIKTIPMEKKCKKAKWLSGKALSDCGSDNELLIANFRRKLKKVGKTTKSFRYDLNQITYDYTVEVRHRFKGLDLIEYLKNYGRRFVTLYRRQGSRPSSRRNAKRQNGFLRRPYK